MQRGEETLDTPAGVETVQNLIDHLVSHDAQLAGVFNSGPKVLVAVNQTVVDRSHPLNDNDEVAFFPPMTGG